MGQEVRSHAAWWMNGVIFYPFRRAKLFLHMSSEFLEIFRARLHPVFQRSIPSSLAHRLLRRQNPLRFYAHGRFYASTFLRFYAHGRFYVHRCFYAPNSASTLLREWAPLLRFYAHLFNLPRLPPH